MQNSQTLITNNLKMQCVERLNEELEKFRKEPLGGISLWSTKNIHYLKASIEGPESTAYEKGLFFIDILIPENYPFEPPNMCVLTPIYHPNVDSCGRVCIKLLNKDSWTPEYDISTMLSHFQYLLSCPQFNDLVMQRTSFRFVDRPVQMQFKHIAEDFDIPNTKRMKVSRLLS
ncbi:ubiquitin-conjugating enzyme E2 T [Caerostris darwini]|uniref:Ubiquitin-conjugating enzyme E2 T n=1 Tax=Caerostris darwini TaxID=1538125 RepID=A0AAV4NFH7_9ARAC|nr:ubiquitin-conjugating enzyme E2 T [Caerostris darwini]